MLVTDDRLREIKQTGGEYDIRFDAGRLCKSPFFAFGDR